MKNDTSGAGPQLTYMQAHRPEHRLLPQAEEVDTGKAR